MRALTVGSEAMRYWIPNTRKPKDWDVFSPDPIAGAEVFWHPLLDDWISPGYVGYATIDELYTLKVSHTYWELRNGSWNKHMDDIVTLKSHGGKMIQPLHDLLKRIWAETHRKRWEVDLGRTKEQFFADAVPRKYDHDSIHASVAYGDRPLFESILKDGETVAVDMAKLKAMPFDDQVRLFREEVYATALERLLIPAEYRYSTRKAYAWALRRTITSLTKGWSAQFLAENYHIFRVPDVDYVARHLVQKHRLIPLEATQ